MHIVTGGTHGIGRACVEFLVHQGERVLATGRDRTAGEEIAATLPRTTFVAGDVSNPEDIRRVFDHALELGGGMLAGLVNNAGMSSRVAFLEAEVTDWNQVLDINARSAFLFTRYALPGLIAGKGAVVNVSSIAGKVGEEGLALYCASKAALLGMTQALALEFGMNVPFNAVCPGQIATRMMGAILDQDETRRRLELRIPAGRPEPVNDFDTAGFGIEAWIVGSVVRH